MDLFILGAIGFVFWVWAELVKDERRWRSMEPPLEDECFECGQLKPRANIMCGDCQHASDAYYKERERRLFGRNFK